MKLVYAGPSAAGIDIPAAGIIGWKPDEERDVPDVLAGELLARGEFKPVNPAASSESKRMGVTHKTLGE